MSDPMQPIPGPDPGACPDCGEGRTAGLIHDCAPTGSESALPCGHPESAVVSSDEGTAYCPTCEHESAQAGRPKASCRVCQATVANGGRDNLHYRPVLTARMSPRGVSHWVNNMGVTLCGKDGRRWSPVP